MKAVVAGAVLAAALFAVPAGASASCGHSHACWHRVHLARQAHCQRTACAWQHRFAAMPAVGRYWARCVSSRESGNRAVARESGFLSYFQWTMSTWLSAGGRGNPESAPWVEQAVRAWRWHRSHPTGQWPNTGEGGVCGS